MIKRLPQYTNRHCQATGDEIGVRFTRIESKENFQDIFPDCLYKTTCQCKDCIFIAGQGGKWYIDWPQHPVTHQILP